MIKSTLVHATISFVKKQLENAEGGHDWFHIERVYKLALRIAENEANIDVLVVQLAALLHDIADSKFYNGDETIGPQLAREFLTEQQLPENQLEHVIAIIENSSFKGGNVTQTFFSKELAIVQDADRLDAIGAIGIARTFNYGGFKNRPLYDPTIPPNLQLSKEEYKSSTAPTLNHFYEKLLRLKELMHTQTARELAAQRHQFMEQFLSRFYAEWEGEA
ncbi:MAG: HD domain-containing protein [Flavobacterium sp.]|nr:HD domain-containing protein [Flavobacterium sp.]